MDSTPVPSGPEKITYQGKIIEVVEQPMKIGEKVVTFESARRAPGTRLIIPLTDGKILLSKEFRTEIHGYDFRLPGGKVFDTLEEYNAFLKTGADIIEKARVAATKEALEEVGIVVKNMDLFAISKCGATVKWDLLYFVVSLYSQGVRGDSGEGEDIALAPIDPEEVKQMCLDGRIQEERSALILLRYFAQQ